MSLPAVLLHTDELGNLPVAGLSLLERLIVAAHRAGCGPITVVATVGLPRFRRLNALGIRPVVVSSIPGLSESTLVARSQILVTVADVRRVLEVRGRLVTANDGPMDLGVVAADTDLRRPRWDDSPEVPGSAVAATVTDEGSRRSAEAGLWRSMTSASDGQVDRWFNRPLGRILSKLLIHTPATPNQVSLVSILLGIWSGWWFARGNVEAAVTGAILLQLSAIIDCVDGDLARVVFKESPLGKWLDLVGDQFVHLSIFAGIPLGLYRQGIDAPWLALGASCVAGLVIAFGVVLRGLTRPKAERSARLERFIDATTNRDFSVLLLILAPLGALEWFVWAAAFGVHAFWVTALVLQRRRPEVGASGREVR